MGWPPITSLTQGSHEGSSVGADNNFSSSQTKEQAEQREKNAARKEKKRKRRVEQKTRKRQRGRDTEGKSVPSNPTLKLAGGVLYNFRRNLKNRKGEMVTHLCPDFDLEDTIRNTPKAQPADNHHPDFEIANEPTLKLVEGDLVTLSDKYVSIIYLTTYSPTLLLTYL